MDGFIVFQVKETANIKQREFGINYDFRLWHAVNSSMLLYLSIALYLCLSCSFVTFTYSNMKKNICSKLDETGSVNMSPLPELISMGLRAALPIASSHCLQSSAPHRGRDSTWIMVSGHTAESIVHTDGVMIISKEQQGRSQGKFID